MHTGAATGFGEWVSLYSGSDLFHYEDRGLTMYTTYQYRVTVFNDYAFTISPTSQEVTTFGGVPSKAANVSAVALNHTAIYINWTLPSEYIYLIRIICTKKCFPVINYALEVGAKDA